MGRRLVVKPGWEPFAAGDRDCVLELDPGMAYGHVCSPEEVGDVVRYVVSDQAAYLNGQRIYVDGGGP